MTAPAVARPAAPVAAEAAPWPLAMTAGALAAAAYLLTLSANYASDGLAFARLARAGDLTAPLFFQAEHLLYPFVGWLFAAGWTALGYRDGPLLPLQVLNALGGGVAVGAFAFAAGRLLPGRAAVVATVALAASYGWWYHASDAEDQILANAGLLVGFAALAAGRGPLAGRWLPSGRGWLAVGGLALAVLIHATTVLFLPAAAALVLGRAGRREVIVLAGWLALLVGVPYLAIGFGLHGHRDLAAWRGWLLAAPGQGVWGRLSPRNLWAGLQSLTAGAVYLPVLPTLGLVRVGSPAAIAGLALVLATGAGLLAAVVALVRRRSRLRLALLLWIVVHAAFGAYWAPDDFQFWLLVLPPLYLLAAGGLPLVAVWAAVVPLALWNLGAGILPRHDPATNAGLAAVRCLDERLGPADLVVTPGWDWAGDLLPYFADVPVLSLNDVWVLVAKGDRAAFLAEIDRRVAASRAAGGRVYLVRLDTMTADEAAFFRRVTGLGPADFPWRRAEAFRCGDVPVAEVLP